MHTATSISTALTDFVLTPSPFPPPLAAFEGRAPDRPAWFDAALKRAPQRTWHEAAGARIETLTWGERGKPGLLLLHGNKAHADWWSFIAPFFADDFHVVASSWSGMGASDWRASYSLDDYVAEADAVSRAAGLFEHERRPVVVAHSFAGFVAARYAARCGESLGGVVALDVPMHKRRKDGEHDPEREANAPRPNRVYGTLSAALARFRFAPPQPCENLFIADHIARGSLKRVEPDADHPEGGWTWRFDPHLWRDMRLGNPWPDFGASRCPVAVMWGGDSSLVQPELLSKARQQFGSGVPFVEIPQARHHVMVDQPLALVAALRGLLSAWPGRPRTNSEATLVRSRGMDDQPGSS
jgi:pimeloyl-ACP methyl ester carboxylesterase